MVAVEPEQGFYSLVRWVPDATRGEAKNVAVVLVESEGHFQKIEAAPLSQISPRLAEQGVMDAMLAGLTRRIAADEPFTAADLRDLHETQQGDALVLTAPTATAVSDPDTAIGALYRALVRPAGRPSRGVTKGRLLDRVVDRLRRQDVPVQRGVRHREFMFDAFIEGETPVAIEVLSFNHPRKTWTVAEHDAGYFLYGTQQTGVRPYAVIDPPGDQSQRSAREAHARILGWFEGSPVQVRSVDALSDPAVALGL